eukprot:TRINITY_DN2922_c0_g1_i1.p1 TRINITY_DN2922_c0_g1~~TRINITY_DN2922_c0_g1_i1.p1  ORF type:complete len:150 (-),score=57.53 TRINITY_DN2922_c0_g1_i1:74-523(-)
MIRVIFLIVLYILLPFVYLFAGLWEGVLSIWGVMSGIWASLINLGITVLEPCYAIVRRMLKLTFDYKVDSLDNIAEAIRGREAEFLPTTMKNTPISTSAFDANTVMRKKTTTTTTMNANVPSIDSSTTYQTSGYQSLNKNNNNNDDEEV